MSQVEQTTEELPLEKLNEQYLKMESCDKELFTEIRSNILMVCNKTYEKNSKKLWNRIQGAQADTQTKVRLTRNLVGKIAKTVVNEILSVAPDVKAVPHSELELVDRKVCEYSNSLWAHARHQYRLREKIRDWAEGFYVNGEVAVILRFDQNKGRIVSYDQATDDEGNLLFTDLNGEDTTESSPIDPMTGRPMLDQMGQPIQNQPKSSGIPVYSGDFVFETIFPANLLRDPSAETFEESPVIGIRKMLPIADAKKLCGGDKDKEAKIVETAKETFKIFDTQSGQFVDSKDQCLVKEFFYRPCHKYPNGWYVAFTDKVKLFEMELPGTEDNRPFPIVWQGYNKAQTSPRGYSDIRNLRPLQANLNQLATQKLIHELTVSSDKLMVNAATKVEKGFEINGVKTFKYQGGVAPAFLPGRTGDQFLGSMQAIEAAMYDVANLAEYQQANNSQLDANSVLLASLRHKKKFSVPGEKFEQFLTDLFNLYLRMCQLYLPDDAIIRIVGKSEHLNVQEFKAIGNLDFAVKAEVTSLDAESMVGKSLQIQSLLQYIGKDLPKEAIGNILNEMPFLNSESMFRDLTQDSKNCDSDVLCLDRGQPVPAREGENHKFIIKRLMSRQKMRDYDLLDDSVKSLYEQKIQEHRDMEAQELQKLKDMAEKLWPMDGPKVSVEMWVEEPDSKGQMKTVRWKCPLRALERLKEQMEAQGYLKDQYDQMPQAVSASVADQFVNNSNQQQSGSEVGRIQNALQGQGEMNGNDQQQSRSNSGFN